MHLCDPVRLGGYLCGLMPHRLVSTNLITFPTAPILSQMGIIHGNKHQHCYHIHAPQNHNKSSKANGLNKWRHYKKGKPQAPMLCGYEGYACEVLAVEAHMSQIIASTHLYHAL